MLLGHRVVVYTWPNVQGESDAARVLATQGASFYAEGVGWTAIVGDAATLDVQRQVATAVATSLNGQVEQIR